MAQKQKLKFYDIKAKKAFETDQYEVVVKATKRGQYVFAITKSPYTGVRAFRIIGKKQ